MSRGFQMLVAPGSAWQALSQSPAPLPALLAQALLTVLGFFLARRPYAELWEAAGVGAAAGDTPGAAGLNIVLILLALLMYNLAAAALVFGLLRLATIRLSFRQALVWIAYGTMPLYFGKLLGALTFAIVRPLTQDAGQALIWQLSPSGLSFGWLFSPLSLPWLLVSSLDLFALWSLVVLTMGCRHLLALSPSRTVLAMTMLMLLWLAALAGLWYSLGVQAA
jgi:hypothetical protein